MSSGPDPRDVTKVAAFRNVGYRLVPGLIGLEMADFFWSYAHTKFASFQMRQSPQVPGAPVAYGDAALDGLLEFVRPRVEAAVGLRLLPTYGFARIYSKGHRLLRHSDRPACEVSVSLNVGQRPGTPWAFNIEGPGGVFGAELSPGDGLIYLGKDCPHWREPYEGERLVQVFLHYVDADGPHRDECFDRRPSLMTPKVSGEDAAAAPSPPRRQP